MEMRSWDRNLRWVSCWNNHHLGAFVHCFFPLTPLPKCVNRSTICPQLDVTFFCFFSPISATLSLFSDLWIKTHNLLFMCVWNDTEASHWIFYYNHKLDMSTWHHVASLPSQNSLVPSQIFQAGINQSSLWFVFLIQLYLFISTVPLILTYFL